MPSIIEVVESGSTAKLSEEDLIEVYKDCAKGYDEAVDAKGYVGVVLATERLIQTLQKNNYTKGALVMDMGAGTGKCGEVLKKNGYENVDALDISQEMLDVAKEKGLYRRMICDSLGEKQLNIESGTYDAIISVGVFTVGHVKPSGFDEIARITKPGGFIVFTVRSDAYKDKEIGYRDKIEQLAADKVWKILDHDKIDYVLEYSFEDGRTGHLFVCQKL